MLLDDADIPGGGRLPVFLAALYTDAELPLCGGDVQAAVEARALAVYLGADAARGACDRAVLRSLSVESVVGIVEWALREDGDGAASLGFELRQCDKWIRDSFPLLVAELRAKPEGNSLVQLPYCVILKALRSDFTQGGEAVILEAALAWIQAHSAAPDGVHQGGRIILCLKKS